MRHECLKKAGKSLVQPMTVCLPQLNSCRCHTQLYARLWNYLSSYSKLVDLCIWIFCMWYQNMKASCMVVFRYKKLLKLLQQCWVEKAGPIAWRGKSCDFTLLNIFWSNVTEHLYIFTILPSPDGRTQKLDIFETCCLLEFCAAWSGNSIVLR